jgi:glycosyltransferase involved in cell wall biosynthesis
VTTREGGVRVVVPHLPAGVSPTDAELAQRELLDELFEDWAIRDYVLWYYSPMALGFTAHLRPVAAIYDCMDELSAFAFAPPRLREREAELLERADLVFTGGHSLYEAKRRRHPRVYAFPSSVDLAHFGRAREPLADPPDQRTIPRPRLGFFGVIDERMHLDLLAGLAEARPDWQLVMLGPVVKIDPASLPSRPNIHYLGGKGYEQLPRYLAGWDVALLPFALNESTSFISPTKTPEYLAGGKPVVSTPVRDVVRPYGEHNLVTIADGVDAFVRSVTAALTEDACDRWREVDAFLARGSWDQTWGQMRALLLAETGVAGPDPATRPTLPARAW